MTCLRSRKKSIIPKWNLWLIKFKTCKKKYQKYCEFQYYFFVTKFLTCLWISIFFFIDLFVYIQFSKIFSFLFPSTTILDNFQQISFSEKNNNKTIPNKHVNIMDE